MEKSTKKKSVKNTSAVSNVSKNADLPDEDCDKNASKRRKLHKTYIKGWSEDIASHGFARCMIASCNFISSDILQLQDHHKNCKGVPINGENCCRNCGSFLGTTEELLQHMTVCKGVQKKVQKSPMSGSGKRCQKSVKKFQNKPETEKEEVKPEVANISLFCCIHCRCGFSTKEEHLKHQENCTASNILSKKPEHLHFRVIKQMKNKDSNDDCIIQPGPDLPKGQYRRRRAYRAEHKNSWALTLEKFKYVKCIYQNCYFIAMSLEDMIAHFGYCNGDGSFAKFVCPYCNGRVTSENVLLKHIERSHALENPKIKTEPVSNSDECEDPNLELQNGKNLTIQNKDIQNQIRELGYGFCQKPFCNFMSKSIEELEKHIETCSGTSDLESHNKQNRRLPFSKSKHLSKIQAKGVEEDDLEIGPVVRQYKNKHPRSHSKQRKTEPPQSENSVDENSEDADLTKNQSQIQPKSRGRPKKTRESAEEETEEKMTCAKCSFRCTKGAFACHNLKKHFGLGWMIGEEPVDLNDEKLVIRLVKDAFKYTKKAACEKCDVVKRSVMGFVSHIQICGKSEEEKDALKVQCPHCEGKYLKYSLSTHIKLSHSGPDEKAEEEKSEVQLVSDPSGKRRSAIKAVTKFQKVFNDNEELKDEAETNRETNYTFYERGSERTPKLNSKLNNLWYRLKRENKKIPCRHPNCEYQSHDVKEAKSHHYNCPFLPEKVFLCELCDFYSVDEQTVKTHLTTHRKYLKQKRIIDEEIKIEEEEEEEEENEEEGMEEEEEIKTSDDDDMEEGKKRKKKNGENKIRKKMKFTIDVAKPDGDIEFRLKQNFCRREKIDNVRGIQFYSNGLDMTLQEDLARSKSAEKWPEFHTTREEWHHVPEATQYLPKLTTSVSVRFPGSEAKWRRFDRFESDLIGGVPVMFVGGSVRSISWCRVSFRRMLEKTQRQYLAVSTTSHINHLKDIHERSSVGKTSLLQIWDCGALDNDLSKNSPKFVLGILQNGGEIWDLAWFPQDTYTDATEKNLRRLGLLATACEDGAVRVWSICHPEELHNDGRLPIYKTEPLAMLIPDTDIEESCLQLSIGLDGIIAGGFGNGYVAVWNVRNISSPFCKKSGKCSIIRAHLVFQAHKTAVTALTFCPSNSRYISTSGLDRFVKIWDLELPFVPIEQSNKEYSLDNIWTLNWPSVIYNFDDVVVNFNKGTVKFIKDILTDRHQSSFAMEDTCLSLSFSDWLNALCGGSITGEVKLRLLKNLIHDQKRSQSTISSIRLERLNETEKGGFPRSYNEASSGFGLVFKDGSGLDKKKPEKPDSHPEEFPIRAINKIAFNPNFKCFTHIALGYNCGLIRVQPLKELQSTRSLKFFLEKAEKEKV